MSSSHPYFTTIYLTGQIGITTLSELIGEGKYKLNDENGDSIYSSSHHNERILTFRLNSKLVWKTDENGYVKIFYTTYPDIDIERYYLPENIDTVFKLLGAIYTFYNQPLTGEFIPQSINMINEIISQSVGRFNTKLYEHLLIYYNKEFLSLSEILFSNYHSFYQIVIS